MRLGSARQVVAASLVLSLTIFGVIGSASTAGAAPATPAAPTQGQCKSDATRPAVLSTDVSTLDAAATTTINVTGTNYLLPPHVCGTEVFGGVYLFFGWVQPGGKWGPGWRNSDSMNGTFGNTYSYPGEGGGGDTRDDGSGVVRLVSFTNGGESGNATDFHMDGVGNWQANVIVRGATYSFKDITTGATATVDCRQVQCGVFTIGAHGNASVPNEQFVPINFTEGGNVVVPPAGGGNAGAGGATGNGVNSSGGVVGGNGSGGSGDIDQGSGGSSGSGSSGASGSGGGGTATTTTVAGGEVGTLGDPAAAGATEAADATTTTKAEVLDSETAAAEVQSFDNGSGGGGGSGILIAAGVIVLLALVAGGVIILRRRAGAPSNGAAS